MLLRNFVAILALVLGFSSCKDIKTPSKPSSGGKTCEIIVVAPKALYEKSIKNTVCDFFMQYQVGLNQAEPRFNVVNIQPTAFEGNNMFMHHRNIIKVDVSKELEQSSVKVLRDAWAAPQIAFIFDVKNLEVFDSLFSEYKDFMLEQIYNKELERMQRVFAKNLNTDVLSLLEKHYKIKMNFPDGYGFSIMEKDFAWIRKESKDYGQGVLIHTFPYDSDTIFSLSSIIAKRNSICKKVNGPADASYMTTELGFEDVYPSSRNISINGMYAVETRGLWKLEGDFMGGPFVNYTVVDTSRNRIIMLDAYLYSPRKPKRDLLMQLEGIAHSLKPIKN